MPLWNRLVGVPGLVGGQLPAVAAVMVVDQLEVSDELIVLGVPLSVDMPDGLFLLAAMTPWPPAD